LLILIMQKEILRALSMKRGDSKSTTSVQVVAFLFPFSHKIAGNLFESPTQVTLVTCFSPPNKITAQRRYFIRAGRGGISVVTRPVSVVDILARFAPKLSHNSFESPHKAHWRFTLSPRTKYAPLMGAILCSRREGDSNPR
jgi:hypothetical protein